MNPWNDIKLDDYEHHMAHESIGQLQALATIMKSQFSTYNNVFDIMILGVAGGNGLQHIPLNKFQHIFGLDVNKQYLKECILRYPQLEDVFTPLCIDLLEANLHLPDVDYVIANLLIEYIGCENFCNAIKYMNPTVISCVLQINKSDAFVSNSPYSLSLANLSKVHYTIQETELKETLSTIHYHMIYRDIMKLKNGKSLLRLDFEMYKGETSR